MTDSHISGGCFCGGVRYRFSGKMMWPGICHCSTCRRLSGTGFGAWFGVLGETTEISGALQFLEYTADSGNTVRRGGCAKCRAPVYNTNSIMKDVFVIAAGSLDEPELFQPRLRIYAARAPKWTLCGTPLQTFDAMPAPSSPTETE